MAKGKLTGQPSSASAALATVGNIARSILMIRGQKVLLDVELAALYGVPVKQLNQAVKRNLGRFPKDFMFQLTWDEIRLCLKT